MNNGYIAGPLFNESEVKQRMYEGAKLREVSKDKIEWYNPIEAPINDKAKLPTAKDIFKGDTVKVLESDYIVCDITNNDTGVAMELGIAFGLKHACDAIKLILPYINKDYLQDVVKDLEDVGVLKERQIYVVCSDIRKGTADKYSDIHIPIGFNQYVIGGLEYLDSKFYNKFDDCLKDISEDIKCRKK
mgnify:CR=1 FL=1